MCKNIKILPKPKKKICYCNKQIQNHIWKNIYKEYIWDKNMKKIINKRNMLLVLLHVSICNGCYKCNKIHNKKFYKIWREYIYHSVNCKKIDCKYSACIFIRYLLNIYLKCNLKECFICSPTRKKFNYIYEKRLEYEIAKNMIK